MLSALGHVLRVRLRMSEHYKDIVPRVDFQLTMIPNNTAKQGILQGKAEHNLYTNKEDASSCSEVFK